MDQSRQNMDMDRANSVLILKEYSGDARQVFHYEGEVPDFDKSDETTRALELAIVPLSDELREFVDGRTHAGSEVVEDELIIAEHYWQHSHLAIGQYLTLLEQHRVDPDEGLDALGDRSESLTGSYQTWHSDLTPTDRQGILGTLAREQVESFRKRTLNFRLLFWEKALDKGEWSSTDLSERNADRVWQAVEDIDYVDPRSCYFTTLQVYDELDHHDDVEYCEGIMLPEQTGLPMAHAWLEIDGEVAEPTLPKHRPSAGDAVYYGTSIPHDELTERKENRGATTTMLLDANEYAEWIRRQEALRRSDEFPGQIGLV